MLQAEKLASLGERVTEIMHELSNPLTSILGNAQRMILRDKSGTAQSEVHRILEEAKRARSILRQLLNASRELRPERRLVCVNEIVQHAIALEHFSLAAGLRIEEECSELLPRVAGDASNSSR